MYEFVLPLGVLLLGFAAVGFVAWLLSSGDSARDDPANYVRLSDYQELQDKCAQLEARYARASSDRSSLIWAGERALELLERGTSVHATGHRCGGPDSSCDSDCMQNADFANRFDQIKSTLRCVKGKP